MEKEISFNEGLRLTPYSDVSPDGELSVCHNVEVYGGGLRPTVIEGKEFTVRTGQESVMTGELMHIHATGEFQHLIFWDEQDYIWWCNEGRNNDEVVPIKIWENAVQGITSISSVGNVLVVTTSDEVYYAIWKTTSYVWLGAMPELKVRWRLEGNIQKANAQGLGVEPWYGTIDASIVYDRMAIAMKAYEKKYCADDKGFIHPFIVRAAYRMMDGKTWTKATPPVLICPNVDMPLLGFSNGNGGVYSDYIAAYVGKLKAYIQQDAMPSEWRELISGIDIFMSEPLDPWLYDKDKGNAEDYSYEFQDRHLQTDCWLKASRGRDGYIDTLLSIYPGADTQSPNLRLKSLRRKSEEMLWGQLESAVFYKIASVSGLQLDKISVQYGYKRVSITLPNNVYENIVQQERLKVAEDSHDTVGCGVSYAYNRRLTLADLKRTVYSGENAINASVELKTYEADSVTYKCYWRRKENGVVKYINAGSVYDQAYRGLNYIFTPDMNATHLYVVANSIEEGETGYKYISYELKPHPLLQGMFYRNLPIEGELKDWSGVINITPGLPAIRYERNTLRTSEVNNPVVFGAEGWNEAGNGRVLALASITKALSEGQFGQFPLMALCTDGNYALEVIKSGEMAGLYGGASAMPRDVCINRESVTQIDGAILFVSNRGVMMADGNDIRCISESLNGPMERSLLMAVTQEDVYDGQGEKLRDFFETCRIIWDYTSQRAIFFQDNNNFALQYRDGAWSSIELPQQFKGVQNIYPYSYIHRDDGTVLVLDDDYNFGDTKHYGVVETRPLKMDTLNMKKLCEFALQGRFEGEQAVTLFGSNDMTNWDDLGTTTRRRVPHVVGRWYKYWRFLIQTSLKESEHISGLRIRYDVRGETRVR